MRPAIKGTPDVKRVTRPSFHRGERGGKGSTPRGRVNHARHAVERHRGRRIDGGLSVHSQGAEAQQLAMEVLPLERLCEELVTTELDQADLALFSFSRISLF